MSLVIVMVLGVGALLIYSSVKGESPITLIQNAVRRDG